MVDFTSLSAYVWLDLPVWVFDADRQRIVWANAAALTLWLANSEAELLGRNFSDLSDAALARLALSRETHARGEVLRESWTLYPRGMPISVMLVSRGIVLPGGSQGLLFAASPTAAALDPDRLRGVEAVQHTSVRISLHRLPGGSALMRNVAAAQAFGPVAPASTPPTRDFAALFAEPGIAPRIMAQVRKGQTFSAELELVTRQGRRWHAVDVRPVLDPVSGARAMQVNARDIADLKAAQKALELARTVADNANLAKSAFLANMSHEIRTPMNGVLGLTELVLKTELTDRQRHLLGLAHESAQGLMVIINDLLDVAKIEAGQLLIEQRPFLLAACMDAALAPLTLSARQKGLAMGWNVAADLPQRWLGDAVRLRQVLINLAGNAVKFTGAGSVQIEVGRDPQDADTAEALGSPGWVRFSVTDTGIGMSGDEMNRVFEPFVQADSSITRRYGGTGLGLAIVARLVRLMGGEVEVSSTLGEGSCFSFALPLRVAETVVAA